MVGGGKCNSRGEVEKPVGRCQQWDVRIRWRALRSANEWPSVASPPDGHAPALHWEQPSRAAGQRDNCTTPTHPHWEQPSLAAGQRDNCMGPHPPTCLPAHHTTTTTHTLPRHLCTPMHPTLPPIYSHSHPPITGTMASTSPLYTRMDRSLLRSSLYTGIMEVSRSDLGRCVGGWVGGAEYECG